MSKPTITKQMLIDGNACAHQVELFERMFGDSVVVTVARAKEVAHLFNWEWAVRLLDDEAGSAYTRSTAAARADYTRDGADALAEYKRVADAARDEYKRVADAARAEYTRAMDAACADHTRAKAPARANYRRAMAPAWAEAFIDMHRRKR